MSICAHGQLVQDCPRCSPNVFIECKDELKGLKEENRKLSLFVCKTCISYPDDCEMQQKHGECILNNVLGAQDEG